LFPISQPQPVAGGDADGPAPGARAAGGRTDLRPTVEHAVGRHVHRGPRPDHPPPRAQAPGPRPAVATSCKVGCGFV